MKIVRNTLLTLTLLVALTVPVMAQTKVGTVDMEKVFHAYYKTKLASDALDKRKSELTKDIKDMEAGYDSAQSDYKQLLEQSNDPAVSADERAKRSSAASDKLKDIEERKSSLESYDRQARAQLNEQNQRMVSNLRDDIQKAVADRAKIAGYTLVLSTSAQDTVIYSADTSNDLSDAVIQQLNAGAPIDVNAPAAAATTNAIQ